MKRSTCIVCGKKRYHSKLNNKHKVWLCNDLNLHVKANNQNYLANKCEIEYLDMKFTQFQRLEIELMEDFKKLWFVRDLDSINVRPERTLKLQLDKLKATI